MCYLAHAPAVARVLAGLVEIMGRAIRAAEALRGLQRRLSMRSAHREREVAQEAVRESRVRRHALVVDETDLGESNDTALRLSWNYARALYEDGATLDDLNLREAVTTLDATDRIARRVLGGSHPLTAQIEQELQIARAILRARKTRA